MVLSSVRNAFSIVAYHIKHGNVNWPMATYTSLFHLAALYGILTIPSCKKETLIWAFVLWPISGFGITVGAHRLWSHRSYEAGFLVRFMLMIFNCIANQSSIYHWSKDHRTHHKYSDTAADPHDSQRGFFYAHIGWLILKKPNLVKTEGRKIDYSDLKADKIVMAQHKTDPWFALYTCYIMPSQVAYYCWGEDYWKAFFVAGALRYCFVMHCTFLVNSAAHLMGDHPYEDRIMPAENPFVSFFAIGEGWHNWHHKYPYDYATSEFGISSQANLSKLFIDALALLGLVSKRKRATGAWTLKRKRLEKECSIGMKKFSEVETKKFA